MTGSLSFASTFLGQFFLLRSTFEYLSFVSRLGKAITLLNSELCKKALEKVGNPNILVNLVARRVRQLNAGGGSGRPLITETAGLGAADIAMLEIVEDKMGWQVLEPEDQKAEAPTKKRKRS